MKTIVGQRWMIEVEGRRFIVEICSSTVNNYNKGIYGKLILDISGNSEEYWGKNAWYWTASVDGEEFYSGTWKFRLMKGQDIPDQINK